MRRSILATIPAIALAGVVLLGFAGFAQNSDFNLNMHANSHATAKDIGLPVYPGATLFKDKDRDSSSADVGLVLNSFHFNVQAVSFVTTDAPKRVLEFYRRPLAKYGEVLECDHGKPAGAFTVTSSGLTCGENPSGGIELRAGRPEQFRIVGIDGTDAGKTKFGLVALVLPRSEARK